jgi:RNA polymerase sigma factor (TIGR02999 family)
VSEFTHILERVGKGDARAAGELLPIVYEELRRLAAQKMAHEAAGDTLQPAALVHEAWMRLGGDDAPAFQNRAHFFRAAADAMRRILIEHARRRLAKKRGAGVELVDLDGLELSSPAAHDDQLLAVNEAWWRRTCRADLSRRSIPAEAETSVEADLSRRLVAPKHPSGGGNLGEGGSP